MVRYALYASQAYLDARGVRRVQEAHCGEGHGGYHRDLKGLARLRALADHVRAAVPKLL